MQKNAKNFDQRFNERNKKIRKAYNDLMRPEIFKLLKNYGITTASGVLCVALLGIAMKEPDLLPEENLKVILTSMLTGGAVSGLFSCQYFIETTEQRKEIFSNIKELKTRKNNIYDICSCEEPDELNKHNNALGRK